MTPDGSYTTYAKPTQTHIDPQSGITGLDATYPYGAAVAETASSSLVENDSPGLTLSTSDGTPIVASAKFNSKFVDYLMYLPPGGDTRWIALAQFNWSTSTNGSATIPSTNNWGDYPKENSGSDSAGTVNPSINTPFTGVVGPSFFPSWTTVNATNTRY